MPVYLLTAHGYRTWREDHPKGYVQRGEGLKRPNLALADHRATHARHDQARFDFTMQRLIHQVIVAITRERRVRLHACATCPTHAHTLISFRSPACTCGAWREHCLKACPARAHAEAVMVRLKRKMGQALAKAHGSCGRPWFSRGWDQERVRNRKHYCYLIEHYLPQHATAQGGMFMLCNA